MALNVNTYCFIGIIFAITMTEAPRHLEKPLLSVGVPSRI